MTVPVLVLLGFTAWTLMTLFVGTGIYRWGMILTGRASISEWRTDIPQGNEFYRRATRAHMNCVENLPVYTAIVVATLAIGLRSAVMDHLCIAMLAARIGQSSIHIAFPISNVSVSLRFTLFLVQLLCMIAMGVEIILNAKV